VVRGIRRLKENADAWKECADNAVRFAEAHHFSVAASQWRRLIEQTGPCGPASLASPLAVP
jgi:hypothetical protein